MSKSIGLFELLNLRKTQVNPTMRMVTTTLSATIATCTQFLSITKALASINYANPTKNFLMFTEKNLRGASMELARTAIKYCVTRTTMMRMKVPVLSVTSLTMHLDIMRKSNQIVGN
jgi:hypothetical protein